MDLEVTCHDMFSYASYTMNHPKTVLNMSHTNMLDISYPAVLSRFCVCGSHGFPDKLKSKMNTHNIDIDMALYIKNIITPYNDSALIKIVTNKQIYTYLNERSILKNVRALPTLWLS